MPDPETPAAAAAVKPFAAWLQEHRSGGLHQELSEALAEVARAVSRTAAQDRMAPQLLRPSEVAEILGVTTRTVRALAERGELVKVKLGRRSARYQLADVERFIERHVVTPDNSESAPQGAPAKGDDGAPRREA